MQPDGGHPGGSVLDHLLVFEEQHGLWQKTLLGYPVWPGLRLQYGLKLANLHLRSTEKLKAERTKTRARRVFLSAQDFAHKMSAVRHKDIWVLSSTSYRRNTPDGRPCIFAQHLHEQLNSRLLFLEINPTAGARNPALDTIFIDGISTLSRELASKVAPLYRSRTQSALQDWRALDIDSTRVLKEAIAGRLQVRIWRSLLKRSRPTAVFVLCGYSQHIPLQIAAKELHIPLIELQHGVIHREHPGYVLGNAVGQPHVPDHIVVFGERFGQILEASGAHWRGNWTVGGQPWLRRMRAQHRASTPTKPLVSIFSQNTISVQARLRAFAIDLRKLLPDSVEIAIKPHPGEIDAAQVYAEPAAHGVVVLDRMADSYALLARTSASICEFSTLALEALAFPCHSLVLESSALHAELRELTESGVLHLLHSPADVPQFLSQDPANSLREELVNSYFGFRSPEPDFEQLIARVGSRLTSRQ